MAQRDDLRVSGGIVRLLAGVAPLGDDVTGGVEDDSPDGHLTRSGGLNSERESTPHPVVIRLAHDPSIFRHPPDAALAPRAPGQSASLIVPSAHYSVLMRVHVADHPLITHKLSVLRDVRTPSPVFRQLTEELVTLLAYEATRNVKVSPVEITTPVTTTMGVKISEPRPIVVPILRAGLGMLEGMVKLLPTAEVGFLGMVRDETTFEPTTYAERLPDDLSDRQCFAIDPMLATGGSLGAAIEFLFKRGAQDVTAICLLGTPEGVEAIKKMVGDRDVTLVLGALDERLNEKGYIVPGLGDAGDRLYGTV